MGASAAVAGGGEEERPPSSSATLQRGGLDGLGTSTSSAPLGTPTRATPGTASAAAIIVARYRQQLAEEQARWEGAVVWGSGAVVWEVWGGVGRCRTVFPESFRIFPPHQICRAGAGGQSTGGRALEGTTCQVGSRGKGVGEAGQEPLIRQCFFCQPHVQQQ